MAETLLVELYHIIHAFFLFFIVILDSLDYLVPAEHYDGNAETDPSSYQELRASEESPDGWCC